MGIHTTTYLAIEDANEQARKLSLKHPGLIQAVITHDKPSGLILSWATPEQKMADNDVEVGWWKNGVNLKAR